ncbi:MAG: ribose-5-phosphate isomerase RpiA [Promethearchaeota archaeon]
MAVIDEKRRAAEAALAHVTDGMTLGVGTGSTVEIFIDLLTEKVAADELSIITVPSSFATGHRLRAAGFRVECLTSISVCPLAVDGADEVDGELALIKGGGAALLREKILAEIAQEFIVIVDQRKLVPKLGVKTPVPVEVIPPGLSLSLKRIKELGGTPKIRQGQSKAGPVITDNGNFIVDVIFPEISDAAQMDAQLISIPGVIETGLFPHQADVVYVGTDSDTKRLTR